MTGGVNTTDRKLVSVRYGTTKQGKKVTSKGFDIPKPRLVRPQLKPHVCLNESNCKTCSEFVNQLDKWRRKNER